MFDPGCKCSAVTAVVYELSAIYSMRYAEKFGLSRTLLLHSTRDHLALKSVR